MMSELDSLTTKTTYGSLSVFQLPFCLIDNGPDGKLRICEGVWNELKRIRNPVNVVAITGQYRTGKSYLLNHLAGKRKGFPLGSSIRAKTKGIWVWCRPHPIRKDEVLLLLDTEGLGDVKKGDEENDYWIFSLSVLLSSTLVYNCLSTIGQDGITKLHYVTELTKRIKTRDTSTNENGEEFYNFFPNFVLVVRDFNLDLEDEESKPITADEYLADSLKLKEGTSQKIDDYNKPRQCIREFFEDKKCFVFPIPVEDCKKLKNMEPLSDSELQPTFLSEAAALSTYIYTRTFPKTVKGQPVNGTMFCHLLETYLHEIQIGETQCVEKAVKNMAEKENDAAVKVSFNCYEDQMKKRLQKSINTLEELSEAHLDCYFTSLDCFMSMSTLDDKQKYQTKLKDLIGKKYEEICSQWERQHGGSEILKDNPEKKSKQQLAKAEESKLNLVLLQQKKQQEKANIIKEQNRRLQQRKNELQSMDKTGEIWKILSKQAEKLAVDKNESIIEIKDIIKGGACFVDNLQAAGSILTGAIAGALSAARIGLFSENPLVVSATTAVGTVVGGACGLAAESAGLNRRIISWWR